MPLAKAYPAGGNVMVDNLWYKDAQEGIQVKPKVTILWTPSLPRLSKKNENLSSPMEKKRQRSNSKDLKHVSRSVRKQRRLPADCGSPCLSKLPFCNKHLQTSNSLTVLLTSDRYPLRDGSFASHNFTRLVAKIPSVMEVAPRCKLLVHCLHFIQCLTLYKLLTLLPPLTLCTA